MTYLLLFSIAFFARGLDVLSTLFVTPDLRLEKNALFRRMGIKLGIAINILLCFVAATSADAVKVIAVASILTALTNFFGRTDGLLCLMVVVGTGAIFFDPMLAIGIWMYVLMQLAL